MGYVRHNAIVATAYREGAADELAAYAGDLGAQALVGSPVTNCYQTVLISPDGSKEGWDESAKGDEARIAIVNWLRENGGFEWVEICYGHDDACAHVVNSAWGELK